MIFAELFFAFFRIGLFTIGGGYAMLPLIQQEIISHGWLTTQEFIDIVAIAEMTPGAIAINAATFVGFRSAGFWGSMVATAAISLPSLILIVGISKVWEKYQNHRVTLALFSGIRPTVAGLIAAAALILGRTALMHGTGPFDPRALVIAALVFWAVRFKKADPIRMIALSAVVGLVVFSI